IPRMGKRSRYRVRKTAATSATTDSCTTIVPTCGCPSKPQKPSRSRRSRSGPTGQPGRQEYATSAAVTVVLVPTNAGVTAVDGAADPAAAGRAGVVGGVAGGVAGGAIPAACVAQPPRSTSTVASVPRRIGRVPVQPFRIQLDDAVLTDLRARIRATRWPDEVPGLGWDQGTGSRYLRDLVTSRADTFD